MAAPSFIELVKGVAADLANAAADAVRIFVDDATGEPSYKDEAGVVTSLKGAEGDPGDNHDVVQDHGPMGAAETFNLTTADFHIGELDDNTVLTFAGAPAAGTLGVLGCRLIDDGTATNAPTFPGSVIWPGDGTPPTFPLVADEAIELSFTTTDGGTTWYGHYDRPGPAGADGADAVIDYGEDADITTQDYDDVADAGVSDEVARADHLHGMPSPSGGSSVTVEEEDGTPSDVFDTLKFPNGSLIDNGDGSVSVRQVPLGFIGCKLVDSTAQSLSNGTFTAINFDAAETFDTDGFHDPASNDTRVTIPPGMGGKYLVHGFLNYAAHGSGQRQLYIRVNGSVYESPAVITGNGSSIAASVALTKVMTLAAGDYLELVGYQDSGGSLSVNGNGASTLEVVKLDAGRVGSGVGALAYHNTTQAVNGAAILLNSEVFDTDGFHSTSANTSRLTVPAGLGGIYLIEYGTSIASLGAGEFCRVVKNGTTVITTNEGETDSDYVTGHGVARLEAGEYVEVFFTGNRTVGHASAFEAQPHFSIMRLDTVPASDRFHGAKGVASADTTIPNNAFTKVTLGTEVFDTDGTFASSTFTAPFAGFAICHAMVSWRNSTATQVRYAQIYKNGAGHSQIAGAGAGNASDNNPSHTVCEVISVAAGDTLELYVYQVTGGNLNTASAGMSVEWKR